MHIKAMNWKVLLIIVAGMTVGKMNAQTVDTVRTSDGCVSYDILQSLTTMSVLDAMDVLGGHGYYIGSISDTIVDSLNYFPLRYKRTGFYNHNYHGAEILIMESLDGLSNYLEYTLNPRGKCNIMQELVGNNYGYNKNNSTFTGTILRNGVSERFEFVVRQDTALWLRCKNTGEIEDYVKNQKKEKYRIYNEAITFCDKCVREGRYEEALGKLDSLKGLYLPLEDSIAIQRKTIVNQRNALYQSRLNMALNELKYDKAMLYCDTLIGFAPENLAEIQETKRLLVAHSGQGSVSYKMRFPALYDSLCRELQAVVNSDIRKYFGSDKQEIRLQFQIHTDDKNESFGKVMLYHEGHDSKLTKTIASRNEIMQASVDSIASSGLIKPYKENNVYLRMDESIAANIKWNLYKIRVDADEMRDSAILSYVDKVDRAYMYKTKKTNQVNEDGTVKEIQVPRLPTKRIYTFGWINKQVGEGDEGTKNRDLLLLDFKTSSAFSWMPSLIVPGVGTYIQRARTNIVSRALPFFLFAGLSTFGFIWENKVDHPRYDMNLSDNTNPLYIKNFGNYLGYFGLGIAGTIYLNELIEGIGNSIKNLNRSKELRKRLAESPIMIDLQDAEIK